MYGIIEKCRFYKQSEIKNGYTISIMEVISNTNFGNTIHRIFWPSIGKMDKHTYFFQSLLEATSIAPIYATS